MVNVVVVDRITDEEPAYCIHGESFCMTCNHAVWLGDQTYQAVVNGCVPVCLDCVRWHLDHVWDEDTRPTGHITDHRRADGPHETDSS